VLVEQTLPEANTKGGKRGISRCQSNHFELALQR
jgi:hypothetical protein